MYLLVIKSFRDKKNGEELVKKGQLLLVNNKRRANELIKAGVAVEKTLVEMDKPTPSKK